MDTQSLSQATTAILSAFAPYVWLGSLPATGDKAAWEAAYRLVQAVRPAFDPGSSAGQPSHPLERTRTNAMILKEAVEQPSETSLAQLARLLVGLFDASPDLAYQVEIALNTGPFAPVLDALRDVPGPQSMMRQYDQLSLRVTAMRRAPSSTAGPGATSSTPGAPSSSPGAPSSSPGATSSAPASCQVCGRSDASLRVVGYPFVISLLVVTFRRTFAGIWCGQHAALYRTLASLITVGAGWWGIPFGLVFTPAALFTLALGGNRPKDVNQQMLMALAEHKLKYSNDPREALRCLEAALSFGKSPAIEARLRELYALNPNAGERAGLPRLIIFPVALLGVMLIGLVVGGFDEAMTRLFSLLGERVPMVIAVLSWAPLAAALFAGGVLASQLVSWALSRTRTGQRVLGIVLAVMASLTLVYMVPAGEVIMDFASDPAAGLGARSALGVIILLGQTVAWGGLVAAEHALASGSAQEIIFMVVLVGMGAMSMIATIGAARSVSDRLRLSDALRAEASTGSTSFAFGGWLALLGCAVVALGLLVGTLIVNDFRYANPATLEAVSKGMDLLENGDDEGARAALEKVRANDSSSFLPYVGLSLVELEEGNCAESLKAIQTAGKLSPEQFQWTVDAYTGEAYLCMYRTEDAIAAYQQSVAHRPDGREALVKLGLLYLSTGEFDKAEDYLAKSKTADTEWVVPYMGQAMLYYETNQPGREQAALKDGLDRKLDERPELTMTAAYYYGKNNYAEAEKYLRQALALAPNNPNTLIQLSGVLIARHKLDEAQSLADRVLAGKSDPLPAFLARSAVMIEKRDLDGALAELERAEAIRPGDVSVLSERAWIHYFRHDYETALVEAALSLKGYKYSPGAYSVQALACQALGKQTEARAAAENALKLEPRRDTPHYVLGLYYLDQGDKARAKSELKTFLDQTWERAYISDLAADAKARLAELGN